MWQCAIPLLSHTAHLRWSFLGTDRGLCLQSGLVSEKNLSQKYSITALSALCSSWRSPACNWHQEGRMATKNYKPTSFSHITEDFCSTSGRSNPPAASRASAETQDQSLRLFGGQTQPIPSSAPISAPPDGKESQAQSATLLRAAHTLEGGWGHQGEVCNRISVYFGPRLRSVHNEEVIRWLTLAWALCWDKVRAVPTGKMWGCQIARVQLYIIHFYSWSDFLWPSLRREGTFFCGVMKGWESRLYS